MIHVDEALAEREGAFVECLKARGFRMTPQRLEIVREVARAHDHPDAETLLRRVRGRVPTLSQDTVYRTLAVLVEEGLVGRVLMPRATRFDPDLDPHHHFICDHCGRLVDIGTEVVPPLEIPVVLTGIGDVRSVSLEICGVCDTCRT